MYENEREVTSTQRRLFRSRRYLWDEGVLVVDALGEAVEQALRGRRWNALAVMHIFLSTNIKFTSVTVEKSHQTVMTSIH